MKIARVYKRTQVVCLVVEARQEETKNQIEQRFESELGLVLDPGWTTLEDSVRWMDA